MSKKSFVNWMNNNQAIVRGIIISAIILLIIFVVTRMNNNDKNEEVGGKPEIEVLTINKQLLPMNEKKETYMISEKYSIKDLTKKIDFQLNWNNKGGIESISKLIFKRFSPNGTLVTLKEVIRSPGNNYFIPFSKQNSFTFLGSDVGTGVSVSDNIELKGVNKLQILYIQSNDTTLTENILFDSGVSFVGDNVIEITDEDLNIIEILNEKQTVIYTPTTTSFSLSKELENSFYYLYPNGNFFDVHTSIVGVEGPIKFLPAVDDGATTYTGNLFYIYLPEQRQYVGYNTTSKSYIHKCVLKPKSNAVKFRITNSSSSDKFRLQSTDGRFLGMLDEIDTVLIDINNDSVTEDLYKTIDIEIIKNPKSGECRYIDKYVGCNDVTNTKQFERTITLRTPKCASIPAVSTTTPCDKDAECEYNWNPCPTVCGGDSTTKQTIDSNNIRTVKAASGTGKSCPTTMEPRLCGQKACEVGRYCNVKPTGGKIVNEATCTALHGSNCSGNRWGIYNDNFDCEGGRYYKTCPVGALPGSPDCPLQIAYAEYDGFLDENVSYSIADILGDYQLYR